MSLVRSVAIPKGRLNLLFWRQHVPFVHPGVIFQRFTQCHLLAVLRESSGAAAGRSTNVTVCAGQRRELVVLSTRANRVEVVIQSTLRRDADDVFLLKYEGLCAFITFFYIHRARDVSSQSQSESKFKRPSCSW